MRRALFVAALVAAAAIAPPGVVCNALATAAGTLFEAVPFVVAGVALARVVGRCDAVAYFGCGCSGGPSARSIPAAAITWLAFGPAIAFARFLAAVTVSRILTRRLRATRTTCGEPPAIGVLTELRMLIPAALLAGAVSATSPWIELRHLQPLGQIAAGAALGFAAPCGLGAVAVGAALHQRVPLAAAAFMCVAGIVDARALSCGDRGGAHADAAAYALLAAALALIGFRQGGALVHPAFSGALLGCAAISLLFALRNRHRRYAPARLAPAIMLAGAVIAAPPPVYRATESTLVDVFPGERVSFSGTLVRTATAAALVRYAITCCRADAAPVVVRLARTPPFAPGTWLRAQGTLGIDKGDTRLIVSRMDRIAPPADPFMYR